MAKRSHDSQAPTSASEDLIECLKSAGNDAHLLRKIIESNDSVSVAAAFATMLTSAGSDALSDAKRRKKSRNRPCLSTPNEIFVEILLFADRDALDAMQLVCRFLLDFIEERESKELPLRPISRVCIGQCRKPNLVDYWEEYWLPKVKVVRDSNSLTALLNLSAVFPKTVSQLVPCLRLAFCKSVRIDLRLAHVIRHKDCEAVHDAVFGDLVATTTVVDVLTVCAEDDRQHELPALRAFEAFESVSKLVVEANHILDWRNAGDDFFTSAAKCGVRSIVFDAAAISLLPALSFAFAEPLVGVDRTISGVECVMGDDSFLKELIKKASELDGRQRIDFKFSVGGLSCAVDPDGFEKYQKNDRTWSIDDLENGVTLNVVAEGKSTEVHVFSSV